ncbi:MAG: hypothetical protein PHN75_10560 [Syntrophales bacterium]|nr:hypothetical protein [Syntrophales bacterium]
MDKEIMMVTFVIGIFVGAAFGFVIAAFCHMAGEAGEGRAKKASRRRFNGGHLDLFGKSLQGTQKTEKEAYIKVC